MTRMQAAGADYIRFSTFLLALYISPYKHIDVKI